MGRRLFILMDGSGNRAAGPADDMPTNVFRLNRALTYGFSGVPQIVFYFSGVGTRGDRWSAVTGRGFDDIVIEAYVNLASNYLIKEEIREDIEIYILGFSRGAAAAQVLTSMLADPGLLWGDEMGFFPSVWRYFTRGGRHEEGEGERERIRERLQGRLMHPRVRFLGLFDAVPGSSWDVAKMFSQLRLVKKSRLEPCVDNAVQLLAINDNRNPSFSPLLWDGKASNQTVEQIWMPGVHADIGGCSDGRFLGNVALLTMLDRMRAHCPEVEFDDGYIGTVRRALQEAKSIAITSERPGIGRKLLLRRRRRIGAASDEYVHPIVPAISGAEILVRGRERAYQPRNLPTGMRTAEVGEPDLTVMLDTAKRLIKTGQTAPDPVQPGPAGAAA